MSSRLIEIFEDQALTQRIRERLPYLFSIAQLESSRAAKAGMEVGSAREKVLIALLIYKFGAENVETRIPITGTQLDIRLFGAPISIKTITGLGGVKVVWTVDAQKAREFIDAYVPSCDILLAQIKWDMPQRALDRGDHPGGLFLVPLEVQQKVIVEMGNDRYLKPPPPGTNPRGVEFRRDALIRLMQDEVSRCIPIIWRRAQLNYDPYKRWVDYWAE